MLLPGEFVCVGLGDKGHLPGFQSGVQADGVLHQLQPFLGASQANSVIGQSSQDSVHHLDQLPVGVSAEILLHAFHGRSSR